MPPKFCRLICQKLLHILKVRLLKLRVRAFKKIIWSGFQKKGLLFVPGNLQWKLVNSLHATTHLGEKALQRLLERSVGGTGLQMTIRQMGSSCPTCQLTAKELKDPSWPSPSNNMGPTQKRTRLHPDASFSRVEIPTSHDRYIHRMD